MALTFETAGSYGSSTEAMRIDKEQFVLIGKTSSANVYTTAGIDMRPSGTIFATRDQAASLVVSRTTDNGEIINFRKDGAEVGNISSEGGDALIIQSGTTSGSGLLFHPSNGQIYPVRNSLKVDNAIDLGRSANRFKDIYLSGGVNFSANSNASGMTSEVLDDYEEGTWTPAMGGATLSTAVGKYTKIGNQVTVYYHLVSTGSMPTSSAQVIITGLPFTSNSGSLVAAPIYARYYTPNDSSLTSLIYDNESQIRLMNINDQNFDLTVYGELEATSNNSVYIIGSATYMV